MPVVLPTGSAQFTLRYTLVGAATGRAATVLGFGVPSTPTTDPDDFAERIVTNWEDIMAPLTSTLVTLESVYWQTETSSNEVPAGVPGTLAGDLEMVNTALLVSYRTSVKGPRGRGRSYLPGMILSGDTNDSANISPTRLGNMQAAVDEFFDAMVGEDPNLIPQVILQRDEEEQKTPPLATPPIVTSRQCQARPATQRRRLRR